MVWIIWPNSFTENSRLVYENMTNSDDKSETIPEMAGIQGGVCRAPLKLQELHSSTDRDKKTKKTSGKQRCNWFKCDCSAACVQTSILNLFPFIHALRVYKLKYIFPDIIAGLSVAILHIPLGMGFAVLADLPPVYGLYSSFWPPLFYFIFGSSPHNSVGTMAVISLLIAAAVDREIVLRPGCGLVATLVDVETTSTIPDIIMTSPYITNTTDNALNPGELRSGPCEIEKVYITMTLCLLTGLIQFGMGILRLGIVTILMPASFINGFTTAAAFYIATSQLTYLFGISVSKHISLFRLPLTWVDICRNLVNTNTRTLVISMITLFILIVIKEGINKRFAKKMPIPVPAELIVFVIGTWTSYLVNFEENYDVIIIGEVSRGVPAPIVPPMGYAANLITDAVVIAILSFVISFAMADMFARRHHSTVDSNQELIAYGIMHAASSFFFCFAGASAPPRCMVNEESGAQSRVSYLWSCVVLLVVMLALGPLFYSLPISVLGSVIIVALFPLFQQFSQLPELWLISKSDFAIWVVTWASTVLLDIGVGLGVGIGMVLLSPVVLARFSKGYLRQQPGTVDRHVSPEKHKKISHRSGLVAFRFESTLYYASAHRFKSELYAATMNPIAQQTEKNVTPNLETTNKKGDLEQGNNKHNKQKEPVSGETKPNDDALHTILIDCSTFTFLDMSGINVIKDLHKDFKYVGVQVVLVATSERVQSTLERADVLGGEGGLTVYPTMEDAIDMVSTSQGRKATADENTRL